MPITVMTPVYCPPLIQRMGLSFKTTTPIRGLPGPLTKMDSEGEGRLNVRIVLRLIDPIRAIKQEKGPEEIWLKCNWSNYQKSS